VSGQKDSLNLGLLAGLFAVRVPLRNVKNQERIRPSSRCVTASKGPRFRELTLIAPNPSATLQAAPFHRIILVHAAPAFGASCTLHTENRGYFSIPVWAVEAAILGGMRRAQITNPRFCPFTIAISVRCPIC